MITNQIIRGEFIHQIMTRDAKFIFDTQARVVRENFTGQRAEMLSNYLAQKPYTVQGSPLHQTYYFSIMLFLRFLDIKYSGKGSQLRSRIALYNRVVWGRLYNETRQSLLYGYGKDIEDTIRKQLEDMDPSKLKE